VIDADLLKKIRGVEQATDERCVLVTIYSFVSGHAIHQERVTDPNLEQKVANLVRAWQCPPNSFSIGGC
jgi:hypothetical protein